MNIEGYTYIAHKLIQRPWGPECRFTVARPDGSHINEVIGISGLDISEADLPALIKTRCELIDAPPPLEPTEQIEVLHQDGTTSVLEVPL
jgi:hypothetical protein